MNRNHLTWIIAFICLATATFAVQVHHETADVSRIVGNAPADMLEQLRANNFEVKEAGLYEQFDAGVSYEINKILGTQFSSTELATAYSWNSDDAKSKLQNNKNNYVIMNPNDGLFATLTPYSTNNLKLGDIDNWNLAKDNLFILDSKYAGLYLPSDTSFASRLSSKDLFIGPLSYSSERFVKALACNLGKHGNIGMDFLNARNNYHLNTNNKNELIGLTLLSYELYGNPLRKVTVPSESSDYCDGYDKAYATAQNEEFSISASNSEYTKDVVLTLGEPATTTFGDYQIIEAESTFTQTIPGELMLPTATNVVSFPANTVITNATIVSFESAENLTANIPMWDGFAMQNRTCYENSSAAIEFEHSFTDEKQNVIAHILPVDIADCAQGETVFYKKVTYRIKYVPYSPLLIKELKHPSTVLPGQNTSVEVVVENLETSPAEGLLALSKDDVIATLPVNATKSSYQIAFTAPIDEGLHTYQVDFVENGTSKSHAFFTLDVKTLEASLTIPEIVTTQADLILIVVNNMANSINTTIEDYLIKNGSAVESNTRSVTLKPGANTLQITYKNLKRDQLGYDVLINIPYLGSNTVVSGKIITNHEPHIMQNDVILKEGDIAGITPIILDADGDSINAAIKNQPFALDGSYTLTDEDSGSYSMDIEADDGIVTVKKTIAITVENTNRPPVLSVQDTLTAKEGQELTLGATATDPDNSNSVSNDDNTLEITYSEPFDEIGKWIPDYNGAGRMIAVITVSDGELYETKEVILNIENTNRAPHLDDLTDVTVKEGALVDLLLGRDPDNENIVDNDDNIIQHSFNGPFDHYGKWQTDYDSSGVYEITPSVTDGYLVAGKKITVTVENVNRAPQITAADTIYVKGSADLSAYVIDLDNTNTVTNDDNTLTITYTSPFDTTGKWTPTQTGTAYTTITVSDGEYTAQKNLYVTVEAINVPPEQTPPLPIPEPQPVPPVPEPAPTEQPPAPQPTPEPAPQPTSQPAPQSPPAAPQQDLIVEVKADGKKMNNEDSIKVKPDEEIKVEIDIENNANETKEVDVEAEIDDLDQEESDILTIEPNTDEEIEYKFEIPRLTDDDEYLLNIFVNEQEWNVNIKIDKPSHEIGIRYLKIEPETAKCEDNVAVLTVKLENTGKSEEEGVLKIESAFGNGEAKFDLPQGETKMFSKTFNKLTAGEHDILVKAVYGKKTVEKSLKLNVEACKAEKTTQTKVEKQEMIVQPAKLVEAETLEETMNVSEVMNIALITAASVFAILLLITFVPPLLRR